MSVTNRILRTVAPSFALRQQMKTDDWMKQIVLQIHMAFIDDEHSKKTISSDFLQGRPQAVRNQLLQYVLNNVYTVADSKDRKEACRRWVLKEAKAYAPIRAVFVSQNCYAEEVSSGIRHPLNHGLWEEADQIISHSLKPLLEEHGSIEDVKAVLRNESLWLHARLEFANIGRMLLGDTATLEGEDWVKRLLKLLVAGAEIDYLEFLGLELPNGTDRLRTEIASVENFATASAAAERSSA